MLKKTKEKKKLERDLESYFSNSVSRKGGGCAIKLTSVIAGLPDRLVIWPGGVIHFVELKRAGEVPRPLQNYIHERLIRLGCFVFTLSGDTEIKNYLKTYCKNYVDDL